MSLKIITVGDLLTMDSKWVLHLVFENAVAGLVTVLGGASIIAIIIGTVVVSIAIGFAIDYLDKKYDLSKKNLNISQDAREALGKQISISLHRL